MATTLFESAILLRMAATLFNRSSVGATSPPSGSPGTPNSLYLSLSLSLVFVFWVFLFFLLNVECEKKESILSIGCEIMIEMCLRIISVFFFFLNIYKNKYYPFMDCAKKS